MSVGGGGGRGVRGRRGRGPWRYGEGVKLILQDLCRFAISRSRNGVGYRSNDLLLSGDL